MSWMEEVPLPPSAAQYPPLFEQVVGQAPGHTLGLASGVQAAPSGAYGVRASGRRPDSVRGKDSTCAPAFLPRRLSWPHFLPRPSGDRRTVGRRRRFDSPGGAASTREPSQHSQRRRTRWESPPRSLRWKVRRPAGWVGLEVRIAAGRRAVVLAGAELGYLSCQAGLEQRPDFARRVAADPRDAGPLHFLPCRGSCSSAAWTSRVLVLVRAHACTSREVIIPAVIRSRNCSFAGHHHAAVSSTAWAASSAPRSRMLAGGGSCRGASTIPADHRKDSGESRPPWVASIYATALGAEGHPGARGPHHLDGDPAVHARGAECPSRCDQAARRSLVAKPCQRAGSF